MKRNTPFLLNLAVITLLIIIAFFMFTESWQFFTKGIFWVTFIIGVLFALVLDYANKITESNKFKKLTDAEKSKYLAERNENYFVWLYKDAFAKKTRPEEEGVEILDHGFDGIVELDNQLPRWWLGLFYFGVTYCVIYIFSYFTTDFAHPIEELKVENAEWEIQIAKIEILKPQVTFEDSEFSNDLVASGKEKFVEYGCVSCHLDGGKGGIGPNLTDDHWINVEQADLFKNITYIIWNGSKNNATMRAFGNTGEIKGNDIQAIASYVKSLNETSTANGPDAAKPQGKIVKEWAKDPLPAGAEVISSGAAGSDANSETATKDSISK